MKFCFLLFLAGGFLVASPAARAQTSAPARTRVLLDQSWRFKFGGDSPILGAETPAFDDSAWQAVTVPHTWSAPGPNGNPTSANGWYRTVPAALAGAQHLVTRRLSDPAQTTGLRSTVAPSAPAVEVFVMTTGPSASKLPGVYQNLSVTDPTFARLLIAAGFCDTGAETLWHDNSLRLVGARLWSLRVKAGDALTLPSFAADYAVFIRPAPGNP